jgi:hypothetical protein
MRSILAEVGENRPRIHSEVITYDGIISVITYNLCLQNIHIYLSHIIKRFAR